MLQEVEAGRMVSHKKQLDYFPMIAAGEGPHSGKQVCGQFGSFIPGMRSPSLSLAILHRGKTGFLSSWDESIEEGK